MSVHSSLIVAVGAEKLASACPSTGFYHFIGQDALALLELAGLWLGPRAELEMNPTFRQVIPYIILHRNGKFVRYTRSTKGNEGRLHGRVSVGIGGHVDLADVVFSGTKIDLATTLIDAARREVTEELGNLEFAPGDWVGLLIDNETDVGRVHVGIVGEWRLTSDSPNGANSVDDAIDDVAICSLTELASQAERLEKWSALLLPHLQKRVRDDGEANGFSRFR